MFDAERQSILDSCRWCPGEGRLGYLEAWTRGDVVSRSAGDCRTGSLDDSEVEEWLRQQGRFSLPDGPGQATPTMRIRLLMCERLGWLPLGFAMSRKSFLSVEAALGLSPESLVVLDSDGGKQHSSFRFVGNDDSRSPELVLTIKLPQMFQLGNLGLALSHRFETGTTVAFLHGWNMFSDRDFVTKEPNFPHAASMQEMLQSATTMWAHPLLLPVMLLREHMSKAETLRWKLSRQVTRIEKDLGVTQSARLVGRKVSAEVQHIVEDEEARLKLTAFLNTTATDTANFLGVLEWDHRYIKFIHRIINDLRTFGCQPPFAIDSELRSVVDFLESEAMSITSFTNTMRSRLDLHLNVLYNFIAQAGNNLNMRIAANAGLDSTAMKTLAVVTMIFLPPTFIATLFSMSMFDWQASSPTGEDSERTIVPQFWIYWAVSVPLTLAIVSGWRIWWHFQKTFYENKYLTIKSEKTSETSTRKSK